MTDNPLASELLRTFIRWSKRRSDGNFSANCRVLEKHFGRQHITSFRWLETNGYIQLVAPARFNQVNPEFNRTRLYRIVEIPEWMAETTSFVPKPLKTVSERAAEYMLSRERTNLHELTEVPYFVDGKNGDGRNYNDYV